MLHSSKHNDHHKKVRAIMKSAGYSTGGQNHSMKKIAKEAAKDAVEKHEKHDHPGKEMTKLKSGGVAEGKGSHKRLDKHARGGKTKGNHVHVNVIVPPGKNAAPMAPMPGPMAPAPKPPMAPPGAGAPPMGGGAPPMGAAGPMPMKPPGMKEGGKVLPVMKEEHGGGSGLGRKDKIKAYGGKFKKGGVTTPSEKEGGEVCSKDGGTCVD